MTPALVRYSFRPSLVRPTPCLPPFFGFSNTYIASRGARAFGSGFPAYSDHSLCSTVIPTLALLSFVYTQGTKDPFISFPYKDLTLV